ncbi:hypothetical protein [Allokutzneria oryzae]|uniref:Uncharacterized protein n=1 Tax=Allokutzneria oryzae TaxID=1378989 RepID=A0ABV5ZXF7_9PSEU
MVPAKPVPLSDQSTMSNASHPRRSSTAPRRPGRITGSEARDIGQLAEQNDFHGVATIACDQIALKHPKIKS